MKQYLLMVTDEQIAFLSRVMPGIQYVEVIGQDLTNDPNHQVLLSPKPHVEQTQQPIVENEAPCKTCCEPTEGIVPAVEETI